VTLVFGFWIKMFIEVIEMTVFCDKNFYEQFMKIFMFDNFLSLYAFVIFKNDSKASLASFNIKQCS